MIAIHFRSRRDVICLRCHQKKRGEGEREEVKQERRKRNENRRTEFVSIEVVHSTRGSHLASNLAMSFEITKKGESKTRREVRIEERKPVTVAFKCNPHTRIQFRLHRLEVSIRRRRAHAFDEFYVQGIDLALYTPSSESKKILRMKRVKKEFT